MDPALLDGTALSSSGRGSYRAIVPPASSARNLCWSSERRLGAVGSKFCAHFVVLWMRGRPGRPRGREGKPAIARRSAKVRTLS
jgi:hypothetical protein